MLHTGKYDPHTDEFDIDIKINEVADLTKTFIDELIEEVGIEDYKKIANVIINEHLERLTNG